MRSLQTIVIGVIFSLMFSCTKDETLHAYECLLTKWKYNSVYFNYRYEFAFTYINERVISYIYKEGLSEYETTLTYNSKNEIIQINNAGSIWTITWGSDGLPYNVIDEDGDVIFNSTMPSS
jgi:hypothetical protein